MHSVMEKDEDTEVKVVETDEDIIVEHYDELVAGFEGKDPETIAAAHDWADGYAEAIKNQSSLQRAASSSD